MPYTKQIKKIREMRKKIDGILKNLPPREQTEMSGPLEEVDIAITFLNKSRKNMYGALKKFKEAEKREEWR